MMKKIYELWENLPDFVKVAAWIGFSASVTAVGSYLLERPEFFQYYGLVNFVLYAIKEIDKKYRRKK